jgi:hypothetical protein
MNANSSHGWILFPLMDEYSFNSRMDGWMDVIRIYGWNLGVLYYALHGGANRINMVKDAGTQMEMQNAFFLGTRDLMRWNEWVTILLYQEFLIMESARARWGAPVRNFGWVQYGEPEFLNGQ